MSSVKTIPRIPFGPKKAATPTETGGRTDTELISTVIDGRYRLLELIGRGGMGTVYKAEHVGIRRIVALKRLHPSLAQVPEVSRRFEREAFAIGRIEHPNCVNVSDFGQLDDGSLYLVMEYLEGRSLGDELADSVRVEPARALHILRHILRGLGHAHENDIVHRDVKPENVLLIEQHGDPDFAKILDFGIAKLIGTAAEDDGTKLTQAGMAFGTPVYMSPEQAVGNPVDGRADLYAASIMAYEMITGKPPFYSDDKLEIMSMHTARPVPPMREVTPEVQVPPAFEQVIARGLAKRPSDRYSTAADFIAAIDGVLGQAPSFGSGRHSTGVPVVMRGQTQGTAPVLYEPGTPAGRLPTISETGLPPLESKGWRVMIVVGLIAGAVALGIGAAVLVAKGQRAKNQELAEFEQRPLAEQAEILLAQGAPKKAIVLLENNKEAIVEDPQALLQLGHAYASTRANAKAAAAYQRVLALNPAMSAESKGKLRANLVVMLDDRDGQAVVGAADILAGRFDDQAARDKLVELASSHKDNDVRHKAVELVMAYNLNEQVNWLGSRTLDLEEGKDCEERRQAISKLRALDDRRALPALKQAVDRKGRYGKWRGKFINRCLREEAREAILYLESLPGPDAGSM